MPPRAPAPDTTEAPEPSSSPTASTARTSAHADFTEPGVIARRPSTDYALIGGGLLLAGILIALATRRGPYADPEEDETPVRVAADPELSSLIDRGLRRLAVGRREQGKVLPEITALVAGDDELDLHLAPTPGETPGLPPAPWATTEDPNVWTVKEEDLPRRPDDVAAPYPALVNVLRLRGYEVLIDLEAAPGLVSICGDPDRAREVITSLAAELATNEWSDGISVTMVGFGDDLLGLAPGSLRHVSRLSQVLNDVDERLDRHGALLSSLGVGGVLAGRTAFGTHRWPPQILVLSGPPTPQEAARLNNVLSGRRSPLGVVCVGDSPGARWRIVLDDTGTAELAALGLKGTARRLPREEYRELLELFGRADQAREEQAELVGVLTPEGVLADRIAASLSPSEQEASLAAAGSSAGISAVQEHDQAPANRASAGQELRQEQVRSGLSPRGRAADTGQPPADKVAGAITWTSTGAGVVPGTRLRTGEQPCFPASGHSHDPSRTDGCFNAPGVMRYPEESEPAPSHSVGGDESELVPDRSAAVNLRLLGTIRVESDAVCTPRPQERDARVFTELLVAVSLHPDGIADQSLYSALWPRGAREESRRSILGRAQDWVGRDATGQKRLYQDEDGRWRLTNGVRSDWESFRSLCMRAQGRGDLEIDALRAAMDLGYGEVFRPESPGGYTWLAFARAARDARLLITTVARRAARLELASDRALQARRVLEQGLVMVPLAEPLWRELLKLSAADGPQAVAVIADRMHSTLSSRGVDRLESSTSELLRHMAPGYAHRTA